MKKFSLLFAIAAATLLSACSLKPTVKDEYVEIQPNETAFLIALDGNTRDKQQQLNSVAYLEQNKVQVKRVVIPHGLVNTCPASMTACWQDVAMARLVKISRAPVTREWTPNTKTGTSEKDEAFHVESNESIDFSIGATITAHVDEDGTAKFLYFYAGKQLSEVMDGNLRSYVASLLSQEFGKLSVDDARGQKNAIFERVFKTAKEEFSKRGITLDNFGFTEGMTYSDRSIQESINKKFQADMLKQTAKAQAEAAQAFSAAQQATQAMQELEMRKKLVDAQVQMMQHWDGHMPQVMSTGQDNLVTGMFSAKVLQGAAK